MYGLSGMTSDCVELRQLLLALSERIDPSSGKLDPQDLSNALLGFQGLSSDIEEVR
jgi:hypothetical protein